MIYTLCILFIEALFILASEKSADIMKDRECVLNVSEILTNTP